MSPPIGYTPECPSSDVFLWGIRAGPVARIHREQGSSEGGQVGVHGRFSWRNRPLELSLTYAGGRLSNIRRTCEPAEPGCGVPVILENTIRMENHVGFAGTVNFRYGRFHNGHLEFPIGAVTTWEHSRTTSEGSQRVSDGTENEISLGARTALQIVIYVFTNAPREPLVALGVSADHLLSLKGSPGFTELVTGYGAFYF